MRRPRRRAVATAGVGLLVFLIALLLITRSSPGDGDHLKVSLRPDPAVVTPGARTQVAATIVDGDQTIDPAGCQLAWSAVGGQLVAHGGAAEWWAPAAGGTLGRIAVDVRCGERRGQGRLELPVVAGGAVAANEVAGDDGKAEPPPPYQPAADGPAPVIDEIIVEKKEVCRGEDNLVTVRAHDPAGRDDAWLSYNVGGTMGDRVPLVYVTQDTGVPQRVAVYGRDNKTFTTADIPEVRVVDCVVPRQVQIGWSMVTNREDELHFRARVVARGDTGPFTPVLYAWDFGDGTTATTTESFAEHSYLHRPQDRLTTTFLVQVRISSQEGAVATGRAALPLRNHYFTQKAVKGIAGLVIQLEPRLPQRGPDGVVRQEARIWHHEQAPVTIEKVAYQEYTRTGEELDETALSPAMFLGGASVPSTGTTVAVKIDPAEQPDVLMRRYVLEGKTEDGVAVYGSFTLMVPPALAKGEGEEVTDERMKQRIMLAMKLLDKEQVTEEDMIRLEERGLLPPLEPERPRAPKGWVDGAGTPAPAPK